METVATNQKPIDTSWKANIENERKVSLDDLKFIFAQGEKRLDDSIKNFDATTSKSTSFISLTAALVTALTAYFFVNLDINGAFDSKLCTVGICCIYAFTILMRFISIILPKTIQPIGSYPQDLYTDSMFYEQPETEGDNQPKPLVNSFTLELYLCEFESYNKRIHHNDTVNLARLKVFNQSARLICLLPAVAIIVYVSLVLSGF